ncbi:MAG TPA: lactate utilization protein [Casimicrobiaceae bacterium]|nr:lactate utilization protein [Casimicrobiaceae bacterium]
MAIDDNATSRNAVLDRVRSALRRHGSVGDARAAADAYLAARKQGPRPAFAGDLAARFAARAQDMQSSVERVATLDDVVGAVGRYVDTIGSPPGFARNPRAKGNQHAEGNPRAGVCWPEFGWLDWSRGNLAIESRPTVGHDLLGITGCCCAIAETGTLVFVTGAQSPSATFLLPETHVAIVRVDQVVPGMEEAFARIRTESGALPRAVNLVSGPSRTGDIEQTIVLGAHGPRRLHVVLVG